MRDIVPERADIEFVVGQQFCQWVVIENPHVVFRVGPAHALPWTDDRHSSGILPTRLESIPPERTWASSHHDTLAPTEVLSTAVTTYTPRLRTTGNISSRNDLKSFCSSTKLISFLAAAFSKFIHSC